MHQLRVRNLPWIQPANTCKASELMLKAMPAAVIGSIDLSRHLARNYMLWYTARAYNGFFTVINVTELSTPLSCD
jgi:hypothetical protein